MSDNIGALRELPLDFGQSKIAAMPEQTTQGGASARIQPYTPQWVTEVFSYHQPGEEQTQGIAQLRKAAQAFATTIIDSCPNSADRTNALRLVREAMMTANASIVLNGLV